VSSTIGPTIFGAAALPLRTACRSAAAVGPTAFAASSPAGHRLGLFSLGGASGLCEPGLDREPAPNLGHGMARE